MSDWTLLTNHGHVLALLSRDADARLRDVAVAVGITERAAQRILAELVEAGYVQRTREGRRNHYELALDRPLRHPVGRDGSVGDLLGAIGGPTAAELARGATG